MSHLIGFSAMKPNSCQEFQCDDGDYQTRSALDLTPVFTQTRSALDLPPVVTR